MSDIPSEPVHGLQGNTLPQRTILIVDDNPENLTVLGELLRERYRVRAANSGARALQLALQAPLPDLILLDVMMPDMDGYEVLERLRAEPATRDIPVIFVTAMSGTEDEEHGLVLGAVDYITKPLRPAIVLARVRTQLELKQARDRLQHDNDAARGRGRAAHAREPAHPGRHHPRAGPPGRDARQRDRQPHPAHAGLCRRAGAARAQPPAFRRRARRHAHRR